MKFCNFIQTQVPIKIKPASHKRVHFMTQIILKQIITNVFLEKQFFWIFPKR